MLDIEFRETKKVRIATQRDVHLLVMAANLRYFVPSPAVPAL